MFLGPTVLPSQCPEVCEMVPGWAGPSRREEAGPGSPPRLPQWCLCPLPHPSQPWGAELSNSSYAAWPVYLGVSGQGYPHGSGPPHLQGLGNRERLRTWGEGARQRLNSHSKTLSLCCGTDPNTQAKRCATCLTHISSFNPHNNPGSRCNYYSHVTNQETAQGVRAVSCTQTRAGGKAGVYWEGETSGNGTAV